MAIMTLVTCEVCDYRAALALHPCNPIRGCTCSDDTPTPCVKAPPIVAITTVVIEADREVTVLPPVRGDG